MQRRYTDYSMGRKKVCAALLEKGNTLTTIAKKHGLGRDLLSLALTRYLKGEHILPRCPKTYAAMREMEVISGVVIMLGAHEGATNKRKAKAIQP